jgi:hypothetical protein
MSRASVPPPSVANVFERHGSRGDEARAWMRAWGERAVLRLRALGLRVDGCTTDGERLVFVPDGRLTLALDAGSHVEVALQLPPQDLPALRARLADAERALELTTVIEALPEQFKTGAAGEGGGVPASGASADQLRALLERVEREQQTLWLGWRVSRVAALTHAALLDELLEDALVALGGLLALVAWTPASLGDARLGPPNRRDRSRHDGEPGAGKRGNGSHGNGATARDKGRPRARARNQHEGDPESEPETEPATERESRKKSGTKDEALPSKLPRATNPRIALRPGFRPRFLATRGSHESAVDPRAPIDKGARVRVLEGPFAGKVGVVQECDGRGGVRVMLGPLAVRLDLKDVVPCAEGRVRPRLSSSHRNPLQARRVRS